VKFWNLNVKRGADGSKHLDIQLHGVIDGGWYDEAGVSTSEIDRGAAAAPRRQDVGVRINSIGGSAFGGVAIYNALQSHPGEVTSTSRASPPAPRRWSRWPARPSWAAAR
jgi:ATP-dependent protease ClpP protease subunit